MASTVRKRAPKAPRVRSEEIPAQSSPDARFLALLRRKCIRAASVGALTATGESIPGLSRAFGWVFGELVDARFLAAVQRELVEETFEIYEMKLPSSLHEALVNKVQLLGTGAGIASDALIRNALQRMLGRLGTLVTRRVVPIAAIVSSAFSNAMVTYAVGKRAQAIAKLRGAPITGMPDVVRAFSGVDERRVYEWTLEAVNNSIGSIGKTLRNVRLPWKRKQAPAKLRKRKV